MDRRSADTVDGKRTKFGLELEMSAKKIPAHLKGETKLPTRRVVLPVRPM
jgi:hypothetical protein